MGPRSGYQSLLIGGLHYLMLVFYACQSLWSTIEEVVKYKLQVIGLLETVLEWCRRPELG